MHAVDELKVPFRDHDTVAGLLRIASGDSETVDALVLRSRLAEKVNDVQRRFQRSVSLEDQATHGSMKPYSMSTLIHNVAEWLDHTERERESGRHEAAACPAESLRLNDLSQSGECGFCNEYGEETRETVAGLPCERKGNNPSLGTRIIALKELANGSRSTIRTKRFADNRDNRSSPEPHQALPQTQRLQIALLDYQIEQLERNLRSLCVLLSKANK